MKRLVRRLVDRLPYVRSLRELVDSQGPFPAGHYLSPIPDRAEVRAYVASRKPPGLELPDVDLQKDRQFALLVEYARYYAELPFAETPGAGCRYYYENGWFSYADAIFLYSFLRKHGPQRIIEVGSGFSSAVMLDTVDRFLPQRPAITLIEPFPERLDALLRPGDRDRLTVMAKRVQEVPLDAFRSLQAGDLLFIDSSHVLKCGSDLHVLMFDVLPLLPPGVFVHFHDVFYPFDYPPEWLEEGRYWNENYFLRAFLAGSRDWSIYFFNNFAALAFGDHIRERMPLCARNPGGSLYLLREGTS